MTIKINNELTITTDHPASSYGAGVLLASHAPDRAFGPADEFPASCPELYQLFGGLPPFSCASMVLYAIFDGHDCAKPGAREKAAEILGEEGAKLLARWLSQHPAADIFERLAD